MRDVFFFGAAIFAFWLFAHFREVFIPLLVSFFFAYIFEPLIAWMTRKGAPRFVAVCVILVTIVLIEVWALVWFIPILTEQARSLMENLPQYAKTLTEQYHIRLRFTAALNDLVSQIQKDPSLVFQFIGRLISTTAFAFIWLVLVPIFFFFFSLSFPSLNKLKNFIPASGRERTLEILSKIDVAIGSFFRGRLLVTTIMGLVLSVGWFFSGVPYWFLLGMVTGLLNLAPYLSILGWLNALFLKYLNVSPALDGSLVSLVFSVFLWPTVIYWTANLMEEWLLTPIIQSKTSKLSPLSILLVVFIGGAVGGLVGLLLAIPVASTLKILMTELIVPRLRLWAESS